MRQLFLIAVLATWACCATAQTFTVVQNQSQAAAGQSQPQAVTESPNAAKGSKKSKIDASGTTGDQMKKSRKEKAAAASDTPSRKTTSGNPAHNEPSNNTAGSIAGNANAAGRTTGQTKPARKNKQQPPPAGAQNAKAQPAPPAPEPKPEPKSAPVATMSGPAAPPYRAPAWLPQSPDSNTVRTQLENALTQDESLVGTKVDVAVNDNEINLAGTVPGTREKLAAERIAKSFAGNRKVINKLAVGTPAPQPAKAEPQPAPQKMNNAQPTADMPAASFAPPTPTRRTDAPPASVDTVQSTPATAADQSPKR